MTLTRDFKQTIKTRTQRDPTFRRELLREGIKSVLSGDLDTGKTILRDHIIATLGFSELAQLTQQSPKSLMRMLGPRGNPHAPDLFRIGTYLMNREGVRFKLREAKP
jgi:tRNA A37 threonylcarbamoyladenosine biosynthesis protein TsaE